MNRLYFKLALEIQINNILLYLIIYNKTRQNKSTVLKYTVVQNCFSSQITFSTYNFIKFFNPKNFKYFFTQFSYLNPILDSENFNHTYLRRNYAQPTLVIHIKNVTQSQSIVYYSNRNTFFTYLCCQFNKMSNILTSQVINITKTGRDRAQLLINTV